MPKVKKIDFSGASVGEIELSEEIFAAPINESVIHQVVVAHLANKRVGTANTLDRGDVRGGGRKPWRQKHTGRARSGSNRSPVWVGGGVAHGPHPRDYHQKVNKKMRRLAILGVLSQHVKNGSMYVVENVKMDAPSTKTAMRFLDNAGLTKKTVMIFEDTKPAVVRSFSNIPGTLTLHVDCINVYDILNHESLVMTPEAVKRVEEVYSK